jgi:hypothetical protein
MSSGIYREPIVLEDAECFGWVDEWMEVRCRFRGDVDAWYDAETEMADWDCPECGTGYAEPKEVLL